MSHLGKQSRCDKDSAATSGTTQERWRIAAFKLVAQVPEKSPAQEAFFFFLDEKLLFSSFHVTSKKLQTGFSKGVGGAGNLGRIALRCDFSCPLLVRLKKTGLDYLIIHSELNVDPPPW